MAETVIFTEQTIASTEFNLVSDTGKYTAYISPAPFVPEVGMTYRVVWDGVEYTCAAQDADALIEGATFIGDATLFGLAGNNEPFIIGGQATSPMNVVALNDTEATEHTVAISQVVADPEGIVLKDRNGNDVAYYGIETVTFDTTTEGKQQVYTKGTAVEGLEIVPDFSGGDMPVTAPEGTLVKSAVIKTPAEKKTVALVMADGDMVIEPSAAGKLMSEVIVEKPDTLVPENIAEGVNIGGLVGTFAGGAVKIASGTFTVATNNTITHDLGVIPDIVLLFPTSSFTANANQTVAVMFGVSTAFKAAYSFFPAIAYACRLSSANLEYRTYSRCIDKPYDFGYANIIREANETTFIVNRENTSYSPTLPSGTSMRWIAIGGLT